MKKFIKSLLIITLLSGNISYAGANQSVKLEGLSLVEKQERLEELIDLKNDLSKKITYVREHIDADDNDDRNVEKLTLFVTGVGAFMTLYSLLPSKHVIKIVKVAKFNVPKLLSSLKEHAVKRGDVIAEGAVFAMVTAVGAPVSWAELQRMKVDTEVRDLSHEEKLNLYFSLHSAHDEIQAEIFRLENLINKELN
ncbi:MAG: hypothetical protein V4596_13795 [Bdellovibrionota bacterium]